MPGNATDQAVDFANTHAVNLARLEAGEAKQVVGFLEQLSGDLVGLLEKNKGSIAKQQKLKAIKASADKTIGTYYETIKGQQGKTLEAVAGMENVATAKQANKAVGGTAFQVDVFDPVLTDQQLKALVNKHLVLGQHSRDWWEGQKQDLRTKFITEMQQGYALGEDVDALVRRVRGTKANGYKDGIMQAKKHEAVALVRSSIQTISNASRLESFEKLAPTVKGIEWVATLDSRTTPICRGLDGKQWDLEKNPIGHSKTFPGPVAHWNCRSTQVPVTASWAELAGKPLPQLDGETLQERVKAKLEKRGWDKQRIATAMTSARASQDGQVSSSTDFDRWLMGKPKAFQKKLLGPTRQALWFDNDLTVADLTDQDNRPLTVKQIETALAAGELPAETEGGGFPALDPDQIAPFLEADQATALQAAAAAEIKQITDNPQGQTVLAGFINKVQKDNPELSPAEILQQAKGLTDAKKAQSQKTSALAKAKKKLLAGEDPTPAQQKVIDSLEGPEADAFAAAVHDALQVKSGANLGELKQLMQPDGKFAKSQLKHVNKLAEQLTQEQAAELAAHKAQVILEHQTGQKDALAGLVEQLSAADDPLGAALSAGVNLDTYDALPPEMQADLQNLNKALIATNEADKTIGKLTKTPIGLKAIEKAKKQVTDPDDAVGLAAAAEQAQVELQIADMAEGALTAKNKTAMAKALEDLVPGIKVKDFDSPEALAKQLSKTLDPADVPDLHLLQASDAAAIQATKTKSSALAKAKKKLIEGGMPTKGQQKVIEQLTDEEATAFKQSVAEGLAQKVVEDAGGPDAFKALLDPKPGVSLGEQVAEATTAAQKVKPPVPDAVKVAPDIDVNGPQPAELYVPPIETLQKVRDLPGTTHPTLYRDPQTGKQYVVKDPGSIKPAHLLSEATADALYRAAGANVPASKLVNGYKVAEFIDGAQTLQEWRAGKTPVELEAMNAELRKHYVVDALLANRDVAGASFDNILVTADGIPVRIDNGWALAFRAQGQPKQGWDDPTGKVGELKSLRDSSKAPVVSQLMGGITQGEINDQIRDLVGRRDAILAAAADLPAADREALARRLSWLEEQLPAKQKPKPKPKPAAAPTEIAAAPTFTKAARTAAGAPIRAGNRNLEDQELVVWHERSPSGTDQVKLEGFLTREGSDQLVSRLQGEGLNMELHAAQAEQANTTASKFDDAWPAFQAAAKTIGAHATDQGYNVGTIATYEAAKQKLQTMKASLPAKPKPGTTAFEKAKLIEHYEAMAADLDAAKAGGKVPDGPPAGGFWKQWEIPPEARPKKPKAPSNQITIDGVTVRRISGGFEHTQKTIGPDGILVDTGSPTKTRGGQIHWPDVGRMIEAQVGGVTVKIQPYRAGTEKGVRSAQGRVRVTIDSDDTTAATIDALQTLERIGIDVKPPTLAQRELLYLHKNVYLRDDHQLAAYRAILHGTDSDEVKVGKIKDWAEKRYSVKLPRKESDFHRYYNPDGELDASGVGRRYYRRWDVDPKQAQKIEKGASFFHSGNIQVATVAWLKNGGQVTPTIERLRQGSDMSNGASWESDHSRGGAGYIYTNKRGRAGTGTGFHFKGDLITRMDLASHTYDSYGEWDANDGSSRRRTLQEINSASGGGITTNTGLFKNGMHVNSIGTVRVGSAAAAKNLIDQVRAEGFTEWPDGRKLEDVIKA